jgi:hypothetical protein
MTCPSANVDIRKELLNMSSDINGFSIEIVMNLLYFGCHRKSLFFGVSVWAL